MSSIQEELQRLRREISETQPAKVTELAPDLILDVREENEWSDGHLAQAQHLSRGFLELRIESLCPDRSSKVLLYCQSGIRSLLAAGSLRSLGYQEVSSLAGGFSQWKEEGLPFHIPQAITANERSRYSRHLLIPEVGEAGQNKLQAAKVLLVGAGGLGSPAALYLAAAGVGTLGIIDHDVVDRSNLQRQILHNDERIGMAKVESARRSLLALNPSIQVQAHHYRLAPDNADALLRDYDLIIDGCDNFATRYLVNDTCVRLAKPNVHGSIHRFEGQVSVFWPGKGPCYRCLHPQAPPAELAPNCAELGVLGVLPGTIGMLEATEALKIILGLGRPLVGRLLTYNALEASFSEFKLRRRPDCPACGEG